MIPMACIREREKRGVAEILLGSFPTVELIRRGFISAVNDWHFSRENIRIDLDTTPISGRVMGHPKQPSKTKFVR